jgi:hypothetical protein
MVGDPIAHGHAAAHWDELLRLATSIRTGTVTASAMLRKLSAIRARMAWHWRCARLAGSNVDLHARLVAGYRLRRRTKLG